MRAALMHFDFTCADAFAVVVELDVRMVGEERHWDAGVGNAFADHEGGEALAEGVVVVAGVPDGNFFGFPGFVRADADRFFRDAGEVAAAAGARVLDEGHGMEIDDAGFELAKFFGRGRFVLVRADPTGRVVEGPMFDFALAALHDEAANVFPAASVFEVAGVWKMEMGFGHAEIRTNEIETKFAIGALEGERMFDADGFFVFDPFVHAPEVSVF